MENIGSQPQPVQTKRTGVVPIVLLSLLSILLIGGFITAYVLGYVKISTSPNASADGGLCAAIIPDYNKAFTASSGDAYTATITASASKAAAVKDNETDPNCVYIRYTNAILSSAKDDATRFADILSKLAEEDKYLSGELANPLGIDSIVNGAKALNGTLDTQDQGSGQGNG